MKECPKCGNTYPETFAYCPEDGSSLSGDAAESETADSQKPAQIQIKTLMIGIAVLVLCCLIAFTSVFFYLYWKPKYGNLTIKTTPPGAMIILDDKPRGPSPITLSDLRSGGHRLKITKEGYTEFNQHVVVMPYATENLHWSLEPIIPQLSNEQLAEVEALKKKLELAEKENILLPQQGADDYNVLYFANRILEIDPADSYANEKKTRLAETISQLAELSYAREDWLEAEKQYKNLKLFFPEDNSIDERLNEVAVKLDESLKDRRKQIRDWEARAEAAMELGNLIPPEKDNAFEAIQNIRRLDRNNRYVREAVSQLKQLLQNRGDRKIAMSDWQAARSDFIRILQYFPEDDYSKTRLAKVEERISENARLEQERIQRINEEKQSKQKIAALRQGALNSFIGGLYEKSISEWNEYLKFVPGSEEAYFYIGACYQNQKQLDTAILNYETSLSLNPNYTLAHINLGILYDYHRANFRKAEEHLQRAKELGGADDYTPNRLQAMIQDLQDRAQASKVLDQMYPVEHKHAFSSCKGSIRFTEQGIEFRATDTDHSFYEAYSGLRAFEINGDELYIKTRTNKNYNFVFLSEGDAARIQAWASQVIHIGRVN
jgi:tetratricopeptide (TPR) repeat protein